MKKVKKVVVLSEVAQDLNNGKDFYDQKEPGVGDYFWDSLMADIKSLETSQAEPKQQAIYQCLNLDSSLGGIKKMIV